MEKTLRTFDDFESAEQADRAVDAELSYQERFRIFMQLMAPYYAASLGFQRFYRVDDLHQRSICDDWVIRIQPVSKPSSDG
jgi:hypothetical protein